MFKHAVLNPPGIVCNAGLEHLLHLPARAKRHEEMRGARKRRWRWWRRESPPPPTARLPREGHSAKKVVGRMVAFTQVLQFDLTDHHRSFQ